MLSYLSRNLFFQFVGICSKEVKLCSCHFDGSIILLSSHIELLGIYCGTMGLDAQVLDWHGSSLDQIACVFHGCLCWNSLY